MLLKNNNIYSCFVKYVTIITQNMCHNLNKTSLLLGVVSFFFRKKFHPGVFLPLMEKKCIRDRKFKSSKSYFIYMFEMEGYN